MFDQKMTIAELKENFIEFDSMINLKPMENNLSRSLENPEIRKKINDIVSVWIL